LQAVRSEDCRITLADIDGDGAVTALDLNGVGTVFLSQSGQLRFDQRSDVNRDGRVDALDLNAVGKVFLRQDEACP
jgi:hypothetical protein